VPSQKFEAMLEAGRVDPRRGPAKLQAANSTAPLFAPGDAAPTTVVDPLLRTG
jgi:hypothetical protein